MNNFLLVSISEGPSGYIVPEMSSDWCKMSDKGKRYGAYSASGQVSLTDRQAEIILLIAKGVPNRLIARRLGLSTHIIDAHCKHIYLKFNTPSRVTASVRASQNQLLPII